MAFLFEVETGTACPCSTSYVSVEYADDYAEADIYRSEQWLGLEEEEKQRLLVRASKQLDARYKWKGTRVDRESGLAWPRAGVLDGDGFIIPDDEIPRVLKDGTVEFALYLMVDDWTTPRNNDQYKELKVDVLDVKFNTDYERSYLPPPVVTMLEDLGSANTGGRTGFKKIRRT